MQYLYWSLFCSMKMSIDNWYSLSIYFYESSNSISMQFTFVSQDAHLKGIRDLSLKHVYIANSIHSLQKLCPQFIRLYFWSMLSKHNSHIYYSCSYWLFFLYLSSWNRVSNESNISWYWIQSFLEIQKYIIFFSNDNLVAIIPFFILKLNSLF